MKNKVIIALSVCILLIMPLISSAYFTDADLVEELKSQIANLLKQVQELQAKLAKMQTQTTSWCHTFNKDLRIGDQSEEVANLASALVKEGLLDKSKTFQDGRTSLYFDEITASAVSSFQQKYKSEVLTPAGLSSPTGYVGARTRAKLNSLYGCGISQQDPIVLTPTYPTACTEEAKLCPDGKTSVGRTGPNCQFAACPTVSVETPVITGPSSDLTKATVGKYYVAQFTVMPKHYTNGNEIKYVAWSIDNIPPGLSASTNPCPLYPNQSCAAVMTFNQYTLYGTPTKVGTYPMTVSVKNEIGYTSKLNFTLNVVADSVAEPTITIYYPQAGEQWKLGESREVKWQSVNTPANAWVGRVSLYKNNGAVFLIDLVPFLSQNPVSGSVYYHIPTNSVTGDDFKVQVILYTGVPGNESVVASDWSDTFSIK